MTHIAFTLLSAGVLSIAHGLVHPGRFAIRVYHAVYILACCLLGVVCGGWLMRWIEG